MCCYAGGRGCSLLRVDVEWEPVILLARWHISFGSNCLTKSRGVSAASMTAVIEREASADAAIL